MTPISLKSSIRSPITSVRTLQFLWIGVAASFFTFAAAFLKLGLAGRLYLTLPHVLILMISSAGLAGVMVGKFVIRKPLMEEIPGRLIVISMLGIVLLHITGTARAYDEMWAIRETVKITIAFLTFWSVVVMFPGDRRFEERFWMVVVILSVAAISLLIYKYYFVFQSSYLGNTWSEKARAGRNLLGWYLAILIPMAFAASLLSRHRILMSACFGILALASVYTASRSSLFLSSLGVVIVSILSLGFSHTRKRAAAAMALALIVVVSLAIYNWSLVVNLIENSEIYLRLIDFVASDGRSAGIRLILMEKAWECFKEGSLLFGIGVKNVVVCVGQDTAMTQEMVVHNDYLSILADLGLIGFILFVFILISILFIQVRRLILRSASVTWIDLGLFASTVLSVIYLNLSTGYNSPLLWSILGFAVVSAKFGAAGVKREKDFAAIQKISDIN